MQGQFLKRRLAMVVFPLLGALSVNATAATGTPAHKPNKAVKSQASPATSQAGQPAGPEFVDGIAAIVNKQVITLHQLQSEVKVAAAQLKMQNIQVPPEDVLRRQVLQRMINEEVIRQEAKRLKLSVPDAQVEQAVQNIAQRNKMTPAQLQKEIEKSGVGWDYYLSSLRQEILTDLLRQREVDRRIQISDAEVDAYLRSQARGGNFLGGQSGQPGQAQAPQVSELGLAQILVKVPEGASAAQVQTLRAKAEGILKQLRAGASFATLAASSSDGPEALKGGDMGVRPPEGWPDLFLNAVVDVPVGKVSDIIQSGNGFHILKVLTRGPQPNQGPQPARAGTEPGAAAPVDAQARQGSTMVTQTKARHILIKVTPGMTDERARTRLEDIRQRIVAGEKFSDLARRYSEDASAPQGGELGWLTPGETVPAFQQALDALKQGEISQPVRTQFGWHLIQVEDRRTKDMKEEFERMRARQALYERQAGPAFEDWLSQVRAEAYIDNRLDPKSSQRGR